LSGVCSDIKWSVAKKDAGDNTDYVMVFDNTATALKQTDEIYYIGENPDALTRKRIVQQTGRIIETDSISHRLWTYDVTNTQYVKVLVLRNEATVGSTNPVEVRCCFKSENNMLYEYRELVTSSESVDYFFLGDEFYIPRLSPGDNIEMHISASRDTYVIVYGDGVVLSDVDEEKEEYKRQEVQGDRSTTDVIASTDGYYDPTSYFLTRSHYILTLTNNATVTAETLKSATVHVAAIAKKGEKKNQRAMEYFVVLHDQEHDEEHDEEHKTDYYPKAGSSLDIDLYSDYMDASVDDFIWEVSLIGNTEFFIEKS
jgi:hypothetical protein